MLKKIIHNIGNTKLIKGIFVIFAGFLIVSSGFASYDTFLDNLKKTGIDIDQILDSDEVSRYELTRLLNAVNCKDCVNTPQWMIDKYQSPRWNNFNKLAGKDFDDINFKGGQYHGESYYYCVAYVGDNIWMRGYPEGISPICNGKFCGNRTTTIGEFLQVVLNIADQYVYDNYLVDWKDIKIWMDSLEIGSYPDNTLNNDDIATINKFANENMSGSLPNESSMQSYLKYCMFNLEACGMKNFGEIKQGYWPVAELNILYDHNIVEHQKFKDGDIHELVSGEYVLKTLYNLFKLIDCDFNNNYDCDTLDNIDDSCPNNYNPNQKDTDKDGIGDVCDDDIDGDGILNPIGIVNDLGRIVISKWDKNMDNCLFIINSEQFDLNKNSIGDKCEENENLLGMYIKTSDLTTNAPLIVKFKAVTQGTTKGNIIWDFGDGNSGIGKDISHEFTKAGVYKISASVDGLDNNANASTTIVVGKNKFDAHGLQIMTDKIGGKLPLDITFKLDTQGSFDKFEWNFGDGHNTERKDNKQFTKIFKDQNSYMITVKGLKNDKVIAVANTIVGVGTTELASNLTTNNLNPNKGQIINFDTKIDGFTKNDIKSIERDWGNKEKEKANLLSINHSYEAPGTKVIIQTIVLKDGIELQNFLTIDIKDRFLSNSYGIQTSIDKLVVNGIENISFDIKQRGYIPQTLLILNRYTDNDTQKIKDNLGIWPQHFEYKYLTKGVFVPKTSVFINECIALDTIETIAISDKDICLQAKINNTLDQYKCDMDNDGIPDICDEDIDGDGHINLLGLIKFEQADCNISMENIDQDIIKKHNGICGLDNCPTVENKDQMDLNNNGRGDTCDGLYFNNTKNNENNLELDSDKDGIIDSLDMCPMIPENYNGIEDYDGCPEIGANINCDGYNVDYDANINLKINNDTPVIAATECLSCPCAFSDYANALVIDDKVKAGLWDLDMNVLYSESIPEPIRQYLN